MAKFYKLSIKEVIKETTDAVSILFTIPETLKETFSFVAGQYVTLKKEIKEEEVRRAYSICSSPKSGELKVAVKAVENGRFSSYATSELKAGDEIEVTAPEGKFILQPATNKNYIGFAAGSGITPVLSMIKSTLENSTSTFTLVYGNKSVADTIFYKELGDLQQQYPEQFKLNYVFSRERNEPSLFGRIDKGNVNYFIKNLYKEISFDEAFLCGPEEMIKIASSALSENGLSENEIHFELFTASVNEENVSEIKDGETEITVMLDDEETTFTMKQTDTLLAASLRNKLDAPYSCQGGVCSSCIALVTEGKAVMTKNSILTDDELEEGLVLTCMAHPTTAKVTVDYDEV
ncbi:MULTISPECIES: ferredoxin--NADP reductase [Tenacibaculum]|uniref:ferredoxin--NADP reductase n=1 Tax=Tenacibaculum TaxID=104267 RepID=UPI00089B9187|nr:ferredoxin--NADP reductase [Tenacibaculum sp. MAR_2010_89]SEE04253.1 ring-1,2-phenylacetyl-CoA epoxidase subunit PaaE [Tenacibaculum sp. MAR_2010_89]